MKKYVWLPRTEDVTAIATVVTPFGETESDAAFGAGFGRVVFEPVVGDGASRHVRDAPRVNATSGVAH